MCKCARSIVFVRPWVVLLSVTLSAFVVVDARTVAWAGQSVIRSDVKQELARIGHGRFLPVLIRMQEQFPPERARAIMGGARDPEKRAQKRRALCAALRAHAERSQRRVVGHLKKLEARGLVENVRPLWISNVIFVEAKAAALREIACLKGIEYIRQDIRQDARRNVKEPSLLQAPSPATPAWNVSKINADDVWSTTGLTGEGVVVAVIDTGMDLDHSDLVNQVWINPAEDIDGDGQFTNADNDDNDDDGNEHDDDVIGWNFYRDNNVPEDWQPLLSPLRGHGTHVAGTIAGDGTGGIATGVAPGARLMVLSGYMLFDRGEADALLGMQYALDKGPEIVNLSYGRPASSSPEYQTWRETADMLIDAGTLVCVAAGTTEYHEPAPDDIWTPAKVPRVVTVGATDDTDNIASISCQGPTSWQYVVDYNDYIYPPGLLKPDVCAPGEEVESTSKGGGYKRATGTSQACPHVSGTAALLLEEDRTLLPHELAFILRETAIDLGETGPDNMYGYGRIDAAAAVNYNYFHTPVYDLSVTETNHVWTTTDIWVDNNDDGVPDDPVANRDNHLYARIRNLGGQAVGNVEIKFYYADVGTIGISGFDPNNDGDPDDGNFVYIDSYSVPVIGPSGSSQAEAVGVVNWNVSAPVTDHWCVGIGIVAPDPPNAPEVVRTNNRAFRNFFDIILADSQVYAFDFFVYPDPRRPKDPFNLELVRRGLPRQFDVQLVVYKQKAKGWFRKMEGFRIVPQPTLANTVRNRQMDKAACRRGEEIPVFARLSANRGVFRNIAVPKGEPVLVRALIRAPSRLLAEKMKPSRDRQLLVINAGNKNGVFGGLALNVKLRRSLVKEPPKTTVGE